MNETVDFIYKIAIKNQQRIVFYYHRGSETNQLLIDNKRLIIEDTGEIFINKIDKIYSRLDISTNDGLLLFNQIMIIYCRYQAENLQKEKLQKIKDLKIVCEDYNPDGTLKTGR